MKVRQFFLCSHRSRFFEAVRLLVILAVVAMVVSQHAVSQQPAVPKLTLSQVEGLVSNHVQDSTMQTQIEKRGLAFAPTPAIVESLRAMGAGSSDFSGNRDILSEGKPSGFKTIRSNGRGSPTELPASHRICQ